MIATKNNDTLFLNILFNGVNPNQINLNLNGNHQETLKEGEIIYSSGEESNFLYLVVAGKVKIKENGVKKLKFKRENEFFGAKEIVKNSTRTSSAMAETDSILFKISKTEFQKLMDSIPAIKQNLIDFGELTEDDFNSQSDPASDTVSEQINDEPQNSTENNSSSEEINTENNEDDIDSSVAEPENELDFFEEYSHGEESEVQPEKSSEDSIDSHITSSEENNFPDYVASEEDDFVSIDKDDSFLEADFVYESQPEQGNNETTDSTFTENQTLENEQLEPIEEDIESILEEKVSLKKINLILNEISANQNIDLTVQSILKSFLSITGSDRGMIFLFDEDKNELTPEYGIGAKNDVPALKLSEGITGKAAFSKKMYFVTNPESDARFVGSFDNPFEFPAVNVIYLPLLDNQLELQGFATLSCNEENPDEKFIKQIKIYSILAGESILLSRQLSLIEARKHLSVIGDVSKFLMGDIKSPMLTIKHYTSIISRFDIPEEIKRVITLLTMQANSVLDLLQSTSDFAEKKKNIRKSSVQLNDLLNNILDLLSEFVESKNIRIYKKFSQNCNVSIDARKFHVAIYELIKYASAELPSGGKIFFSTEYLGKEVQIRIYNEGKFQQPERFPLISRADLSIDIAEFFLNGMDAKFSVAEKTNGGVIFIISLDVISN